MDKLKPCPFCGSEEMLSTTSYVFCKKCDARGPVVYSHHPELWEDLTKSWNTRHEGGLNGHSKADDR